MTKTFDIAGAESGRLRVLRRTSEGPKWICVCAKDLGGCGTEVVLSTNMARRNKSCGCYERECRSIGVRRTHGQSHNSAAGFYVWCWMRRRCRDEREPSYPRYGGAGVYVCPRWSESFDAFISDMGPRPSPSYSVDRRDNNGSYTCGRCDDCIKRGAPMNCRWATDMEQARNMSTNTRVTFAGETMCIAEWSERVGIKDCTISHRLRNGWSPERALTTPVAPRKTAR